MRATGPLLAFQLAERKRARFFKRCDRMGTEIIVGVGHDVATPGRGECFKRAFRKVLSRLFGLSLQEHHCEPTEHAPPVSLDNLGGDAGLLENHLAIFRPLAELDRNPALAGEMPGDLEAEAQQSWPIDQEIISEMVDHTIRRSFEDGKPAAHGKVEVDVLDFAVVALE